MVQLSYSSQQSKEESSYQRGNQAHYIEGMLANKMVNMDMTAMTLIVMTNMKEIMNISHSSRPVLVLLQ